MDRIEINNLFDAMQQEKDLREQVIFEAVYADPEEANRKKLYFLHHVDECPPEVIGYCQEVLQPKSTPVPY
ncbi:MAG TPA: hypothetical protein VJJ20_02560 [Candidatus Paceibacterota bacterium]